MGHTTLELLREILIPMTICGMKPDEFKDRIIFMSMYNDIDWLIGEENFNSGLSNSTEVRDNAHRFPKGHWSLLCPGNEQKWNRTHTCKREGHWSRSAEMMMLNFKESGHPVFRPTRALDRGSLRKKGGQLSIHFSGDSTNAELLFRTLNSANQLSVYGAVAEWCGELAQQISAHASSRIGKPIAHVNEQLDFQVAPEDVTFRHRDTDCAGRQSSPPSYLPIDKTEVE